MIDWRRSRLSERIVGSLQRTFHAYLFFNIILHMVLEGWKTQKMPPIGRICFCELALPYHVPISRKLSSISVVWSLGGAKKNGVMLEVVVYKWLLRIRLHTGCCCKWLGWFSPAILCTRYIFYTLHNIHRTISLVKWHCANFTGRTTMYSFPVYTLNHKNALRMFALNLNQHTII